MNATRCPDCGRFKVRFHNLCRQCAVNVRRKVYVVILHRPSQRCFTLNRQYERVHDDLPWTTFKGDIHAQAVSTDVGWLPTIPDQRPLWIDGLPETEFTAYWFDPGLVIGGPTNKPTAKVSNVKF